MSGKKVMFAAKRPSQITPSDIDGWVEKKDGATTAATPPAPAAPPAPSPPDIKMKRLTIDVPISLHRKIKTTCALKNLHMADEIRDLLEQHFGGQGTGEGAAS
ncbi:MAG TPA: hypothetical protein VG826_26330 [Pirellulales bacterium]|nr:hypothetical protein [Pirellulales bacterium]